MDEHSAKFWATPLGETLGDYNAGRTDPPYVVLGLRSTGKQALILTVDKHVTIAQVYSYGSVGRWECTPNHYAEHIDLYEQRFPVKICSLG